jgi:23S rRNA (uracil1939-C5)-methyltransferase
MVSAIETGLELVLNIEDIALPDGYGVARHEGRVVFVPGAFMGDMVRTRIVKTAKGTAYGEVVEIEQPSAFREQPQCPYVGTCGGCELQGLSYDKQCEIKENHLRQTLKRIGGLDLRCVSILKMAPSVDKFCYRNKIEFSFGSENGSCVLGLTERVSPLQAFTGRIIPIDGCRLFDPVAEEILHLVRDFIAKTGLKAFDPISGRGSLSRLVLRQAKYSGEIMVNFVTHSDPGVGLAEFARQLRDAVESVTSVYITTVGRLRLLAGKSYILERVGHIQAKIYPQSFFQPNPKTAEELYRHIPLLSQLQGEELVGLYCGAGTAELFLSSYVRRITAIDVSGESIACAKENAALNGVENIHFIKTKAENAAHHLHGHSPDVVLVDPPRSGMTKETIKAVKNIDPAKVVYISCNPSTLARDLKALGEGYIPKEIIPFDFFPHTGHFEVLTFLARK